MARWLDDVAAWLHEGGADAMAALALAGRGEAELAYVQNREREAEAACATGLETSPLNEATVAGNFDLHYQCGLVFWLALDKNLRDADHNGLNDLNRLFFSKVRTGEPWNEATFLEAARELGASENLLAQIIILSRGGYADASREIDALGMLARQSLTSNAGS